MSVFESLRVHESEPRFLEPHLQRLRAACADRKFEYDPQALSAVGAILRQSAGGLARIYVTAGDGPIAAPPSDCRIFVLIEPRPPPSQASWDLEISEHVFTPVFRGLKTANYWPNVDALCCGQANGKDEALLFNHRSELVSACTANVFLVHGSSIRTPSTLSGARAGVVREALMQRLAVEESSLFKSDVETADEVFLTNSWVGIASVRSVRDRPIRSRDVFLTLRNMFP